MAVLVVVVAAIEWVETTLLGPDNLLMVVAATEGEGVAETPLVLVAAAPEQWGVQKRNRASSVKIILIFVRMPTHFTICIQNAL